MTQKTICLIDGSGYIFRAFYALPPMNRLDGTPTNAVYGFINMMGQILDQNRCSHIVVVFDAARHNFRNDIYPPYKATRRETPPDLIPQFPLIRQACKALNISCVEMSGYEADDLIATYARLAVEQGFQARVITADKDLMQLMRENVTVYDPMKKKTLTPADVTAKFGVLPDKVVDVQALMGDTTDNVPGAAGIGPKTAAELINKFGSLENIFNHIEEVTPEKRRLGLMRDKEQIFISQKLVQLNAHAPVDSDLTPFAAREVNPAALKSFLLENNFKSLIVKFENRFRKTTPLPASAAPEAEAMPKELPLNPISKSPQQTDFTDILSQKPTNCVIIRSFNAFQKIWTEHISSACAFQLYTASDNITLAGASFVFDDKTAYYVPVLKENQAQTADLFSFQAVPEGVSEADFVQALIKRFNAPSARLITVNLKNQLHLIEKYLPQNISLSAFEDIALISYVQDGTKLAQNLHEMYAYYFHKPPKSISDLTGSAKNKTSFENIPLEQKAPVCMAEAWQIRQLFAFLNRQLNETAAKIYRQIDFPLTRVLFSMEREGILIDQERLKRLNDDFTKEINRLMNVIYELAGESFNINSPAQVGYILFEKLGLPGGKKNHSGGFSTDVKTLTDLAQNGVEIAEQILEYRLYGKLKSTYIEALTTLADQNKRVHTTFLQTATNTGRLSSVDPNLQNIPVRTNAGKEIRQTFIAKNGYKIISADYSQIELRLMAHVANVKQLIESFQKNEDIHRRTAAQIFNVAPESVDFDLRRRAKAVNFGIIYGISAFGLAEQLKISRTDAKKYIEAYFAHYPEIQDYMKRTTLFAQQHGYVETLFKRRCYIMQMNDPKMKSFAARAAINAPIQGGAADIIKMAMNAVYEKLLSLKTDIHLLLQVHDELVFEVKADQAEAAAKIIKETMESVVQLSVPLVVDVGINDNWKDAH